MFRRIARGILILAAAAGSGLTAQSDPGRTATEEEIRERNITVLPNGIGLPAGSGTAKLGRAVYDNRCAGCHGQHGEGVAPYPPLAGGVGTLKSAQPVITVGSDWPYATTVWDYVNRAMPPAAPGSLTPSEVYSATAYMLYLNGIIKENDVMDAASLPAVKMPNRDGFVPDPRPDTGSKSR